MRASCTWCAQVHTCCQLGQSKAESHPSRAVSVVSCVCPQTSPKTILQMKHFLLLFERACLTPCLNSMPSIVHLLCTGGGVITLSSRKSSCGASSSKTNNRCSPKCPHTLRRRGRQARHDHRCASENSILVSTCKTYLKLVRQFLAVHVVFIKRARPFFFFFFLKKKKFTACQGVWVYTRVWDVCWGTERVYDAPHSGTSSGLLSYHTNGTWCHCWRTNDAELLEVNKSM
jgi:hypothetical protein